MASIRRIYGVVGEFINFGIFTGRYVVLNDGQFNTLEIIRASLDDCGTYTATARNEHGSVSCHCSLVVDKGIRAYIAPEFFGSLDAEQSVREGEELRLSAQIEAYPAGHYFLFVHSFVYFIVHVI